jgi:hypothetical protein
MKIGAQTFLLTGGAAGTSIWDTTDPTNFTLTYTAGGKISASSATATQKKILGGGYTGFCPLENSGSADITITGSNTFADLTNTSTGGFKLTAGTTQTVAAFSLASAPLYSDTPGTAASLSMAAGTVNAVGLTITDNTATGGATWNALTTDGNTDGGGNTGWNFSTPGPTPAPSPSPSPTPAPAPSADRPTPFPRHSTGDSTPHYPKFRTSEQIDADRKALWGIDEPAEKVVEKVARKVIARAQKQQQVERRTEIQPQFDPLEWLASHHDQQRKVLEGDLRRKKIEWGLQYWLLLKLEVERQWMQEQEDEQIVALLMEL